MISRTLQLLSFSVIALGFVSTASAATLAGLTLEIGPNVDALVRDDITKAVDDTLNALSSWSWVSTNSARARMNPVVRDCFTGDCLQKAGKSVGAEAGIRIEFSGESQIYDWSFAIYDLRSGKELHTAKGACELCGRAEVTREFSASLQQAASATALPKRSVATTTTTPPPRRVAQTPPPDDTLAGDPPPLQTSDAVDPTADLVMVEVSVEPSDAKIMMGDETLGTGNAIVSLAPGSHVFQFQREGYQGLRETFVVGPQTSRRALMRVHLSRTDPEAVIVGGSEGPLDRLGGQRITYGVIGLATGGVLLATGAYLNYLDGRPACDATPFEQCPEVYATGGMAFLTTLTGAVLATGGAVFLAWEVLAGESEGDASAKIAPIAGPGTAGVGLFGRF